MAKNAPRLVRTNYAVNAKPDGRGKWMTGVVGDGTREDAAWGSFADAASWLSRAAAADRAKNFGGFVVDLRERPLSRRTKRSAKRTR